MKDKYSKDKEQVSSIDSIPVCLPPVSIPHSVTVFNFFSLEIVLSTCEFVRGSPAEG